MILWALQRTGKNALATGTGRALAQRFGLWDFCSVRPAPQ
jgi:hypothetical protein